MKYAAMYQFWGLLFLKGYDQRRYGWLSVEWKQAYSNKKCDLYPEEIYSMINLMQIIPPKKSNPSPTNGKNKFQEEEPPTETSFDQKRSKEEEVEEKKLA